MRLYVIRHGKAQRESSSGTDEDRELKGRGRRQAAWLGAELHEGDQPPTLVLTSGFARARQTADLIAEACDCRLEESPELVCGASASEIISLIESYVELGCDEVLAVVGHNPTLSDVVETLCRCAATDGLWLRTGECAVMNVEPGYAEFVELLRSDD